MDLEKKGVHVIEDFQKIQQGTVMIRSHGVGKQIYEELEHRNFKIIDGTCPFVKRIHEIVQKAYEQGKNIIIIGDKKHPEVQGINGWCQNSAVIIGEIEEAQQYPFVNQNYTVVVQTTFRKTKLQTMLEILQQKGLILEVFNTICSDLVLLRHKDSKKRYHYLAMWIK